MLVQKLARALIGLSLSLVIAAMLVEVPSALFGLGRALAIAPKSCDTPCESEACTLLNGDPGICPNSKTVCDCKGQGVP
jgi:hypothetical protein